MANDDVLSIIEDLKKQLNELSDRYKALRQEKAGEIKQQAAGENPAPANATANAAAPAPTGQAAPPDRSPQTENASPAAASGSGIPTTLTGSVGRGGDNKEVDVRAVQQRLIRNAIQLEADGKIGPKTIEAIERFQRARIGVADGRVDPGGNTWKALLGQQVPRQEPPANTTGANVPSGYCPTTGQALGARARSTAKSMGTVGRCYAGVCRTVNGFYGSSILHGMSAYMGAALLARQPNLFQETSGSHSGLRSLPAGAIVVWAAGGGPHRTHGHICVSLGNGQEASDHVNQMYVWNGGRFRIFLPKARNR